jgi:hypothetical protein
LLPWRVLRGRTTCLDQVVNLAAPSEALKRSTNRVVLARSKCWDGFPLKCRISLPDSVMKRPALIVVDMLNDFLQAWPPAARQKLVRSTDVLVDIVRSQAGPIIWVRQEFRPDLADAFLEVRAREYASRSSALADA